LADRARGDGFTRQLKAIREHAAAHDIKIASVYREEGVSGTQESADRPAWSELMAALRIQRRVTNEQFARFVKGTEYVTVAERKPRAEDYPQAPPEKLVACSVVFSPPDHPVGLTNHFRWWNYVPGANWRHPEGRTPTSTNG
jgi:formylglycine-generating enzyme required for sulfatase activity